MASPSNVVELPDPPRQGWYRAFWPRTQWGRRIAIGIASVLAVVLALIAVLLYSPLLAIERIVVQGNTLTPTVKIEAALEPLVGVPLPRVGPGKVESLLAEQPAVKSVVIQAEAPETLHVVVEEYQPVAVIGEAGAFTLVSETGAPLASVEDREGVELPFIEGVDAGQSPEIFTAITAVLATLPQDVLAQMTSATAQSIDSVELKLASGERVVWGNSEHGPEKAAVLAALLTVETPEDQPPVTVIDVSSPERPVTK